MLTHTTAQGLQEEKVRRYAGYDRSPVDWKRVGAMAAAAAASLAIVAATAGAPSAAEEPITGVTQTSDEIAPPALQPSDLGNPQGASSSVPLFAS